MLFTKKAMGNGRFSHIHDIIVFDQEAFDNTQTVAMQEEVSAYNDAMVQEGKNTFSSDPDAGVHETVFWAFLCAGDRFAMPRLSSNMD